MRSSLNDLDRFAEKYLLARHEALKTLPESGTCDLELEWNLLDSKRELEPLAEALDRRLLLEPLVIRVENDNVFIIRGRTGGFQARAGARSKAPRYERPVCPPGTRGRLGTDRHRSPCSG